jgi:hypothetical protein
MAKPRKSTKSSKGQESPAPESSASSSAGDAVPFNAGAAAQSAAAMLAARQRLKNNEAAKESEAFKKLKASVNTPQVGAGSPLSNVSHLTKPQQGHGFARQVGHNQTVGGNRLGVPRRTSG